MWSEMASKGSNTQVGVSSGASWVGGQGAGNWDRSVCCWLLADSQRTQQSDLPSGLTSSGLNGHPTKR